MGQSWGDFLPMSFHVLLIKPESNPTGSDSDPKWIQIVIPIDFQMFFDQWVNALRFLVKAGDSAGCLRSAHFRAALVLTLERWWNRHIKACFLTVTL